ncbi:MAG: HlyC/CorC family transporter [Candidatus Coatesbacteria bacterium]|nr:HlyC/CorC family transporter [Candidatus Coatesbacteria bacterium]
MTAQIFTVIFLLLLSFFFSGSEAAMLYLSRMKFRRAGVSHVRASGAIGQLLSDLPGLITTLLLGNEFVNVAFSSVVASIMVPALGERVGSPVAFLSALGLVILFGELTPKSLALRYPEDFALSSAHPLRFLYTVLSPIRAVVRWLTGLIFRGTLRRSQEKEQAGFTDDEFESLIQEGLAGGMYKKDEADLMRRILGLSKLTVKEVMTPRTKVVAMSEDTTVAEAAAVLRDSYFSRIPVYSETIDNIQGIVLAKDLLKALKSKMRQFKIKKFLREVPLVPETKKANRLIALLVAERTHLAVVIDEYGGTEGIVTLEDVLEEIVGEIVDEKDESLPDISSIGPNSYRVSASVRLDQFAAEIGISLPEGDYDTVAGFIVTKLGRIPEQGEVVTEGDLVLEVLKTEEARIVALMVRVHPDRSKKEEPRQQ